MKQHLITTCLLFITSAAQAATWYVAPSGNDVAAGTNWVTAKQTIQAAIDAAAASDTVLVSNGVYETGGRVAPGSSLTNRVLIDKAITVRSVNGPAVTTIRGAKDPITSSNGNAAVRCVWITDGATLAGFTVTNGATRGPSVSEGTGGGVRASEFSSAMVSNCVLTGNHAFDGGGAYGVTLNNCTLIGNTARFSAGGVMSSTANNCALIGNSADAGGGALESYLNNCTLTGNSASTQGGGAYSCVLKNCIAYHNTAPLYPNYDPNSECSYTCTTPLPGGTGNITNDPQFVNAGAGNVRLALGSPCRDTGNNADAPGSTDLDGNPRIAGGTVDMGAYEFQLAATGMVHYVNLGNPIPIWPYASWATAATNIQDAIDAALPGNTVLVSNGVYQTGGRVVTGALTNRVVIDKAITVQSVNGPSSTTIRGNGLTGDAAVRCVWMTNGAKLVGFTLANGSTRAFGSGDEFTQQNGGGAVGGTLDNCTLTGNSARHGGGAYGCIVNNSTLIGNSAGFSGGGARESTLNNCRVTGNSSGLDGGGVYNCTVNNGTVGGNSSSDEGGGAWGGTLNNCIVYLNTAPNGPNYKNSIINYTCTTPDPGGTGNITNDPQFVNAGAGNYRLLPTSLCRDAGSNGLVVGATDLDGNARIFGAGVDMGAYEYAPATRYVNINNPTPVAPYTSWATAATNIQDAVDASFPEDTVLVSNGVYQTGGRVVPGLSLTNRVVIDKPITVRSVNGPAVTTIRGAKDPITLSNGTAAVRCVWMTNGASLVGFTITNGATSLSFVHVSEYSGGGAYGGMLSNCTLTGNSAYYYGGGAYTSTLNNCTLSGNMAYFGGGAYEGTLNNCTLSGNSAGYGGGGTSYGTLNNCILTGNMAYLGGGAYEGTLNNCMLSGNSAGYGGGGTSYGMLNNCTLSGNSAQYGGGTTFGTLNNCIVYFNSASNGPNHYGDTINHSCTTPLPPGSGNIAADPQFVNAGAENYRLRPSSPGINGGNNAAAVGAIDLDGNTRIIGDVVDMGAYEFAYAIRYVNVANPTPVAPYTNWMTAATNIQDAIDASMNGDVVMVSNGVYMTGGRVAPGSLLTNRVVIDKVITVRSVNGPAFTTIRGAGPNGDAAVRCVWMTNSATLVGFTITNGATRTSGDTITERSGGGLWAPSTAATIRECILTGNSAAYLGGGAYDGTLNNCLLIGNSAALTGGGAQNGVLNNCTLINNSANTGGGAADSELNNCISYFNHASSDENYLNGANNYTCTTPLPVDGTGNITNDPRFVNAAAGNVMIGIDSPCINRGNNSLASGANDLDGNPRMAFSVVDMGAYELPQAMVATGLTHYVALDNPSAAFPYTNWTTAAANIQYAVDASSAGSLILVSNGVYTTGGRAAAGYSLTNRVVIDKPIIVQSVNGPAATTIRGAWDPVTTNGSAAVRCVLMTNGATLVGFTITNGATSSNFEYVNEYAGGGANGGALNGCILSGNSAHYGGGAAFGTLNNCILAGNSAYFGGGVHSATQNNCILSGNVATYGGGATYSTLNNCKLSGNSAANGGGSYYATLNNCTLSGNSAQTSGGGSYYATLNNCIAYFNTAPSGPNHDGGAINYTCTTPLPGGSGNITNDPQFANAGAGDFRVLPSSPCVNAGDNARVVGSTDLAGAARISGGQVDLGAYEYALAVRYVRSANPTPAAPYTNWATAAVAIQDAVDASLPGDTVLVSNGVYMTGGRAAAGSLLVNRVMIDKPITVQSINGPAVTVIRGAGPNGNAAVRCVWMTNGATLVGFTMTNGATRTSGDFQKEQSGGGLWAQSTAVVVSRCVLMGNSAAYSGGGALYGTLNNCLLIGNSALLTGGGAQSSLLNNSTLTGNSAAEGGGTADCELNNCISYFNQAASGENYLNGTNNFTCTTPLPVDGTGNITNNPQFVNAATGDARIGLGSPAINRGNNNLAVGSTDLDENPRVAFVTVDMGAYEYQTPLAGGLTHYVAVDNPSAAFPYTNWMTAAATIQDAIDAASAGSIILVTNGTYSTGGRRIGNYYYNSISNRVIIDKPVTVQSVNGPAVTTIRGESDTNYYSYANMRCVWMTEGATLSGFTLTNGNTLWTGETFSPYSAGGGIFCETESATVSNCVISGNTAKEVGGGVNRGTLYNCTLSGNSARVGGGAFEASLNNCTLDGNSAIAIGGGAYGSILNNCLVLNNSGTFGGGANDSTLNNCTLTANSALSIGGGARACALNNSIVYFNTAPVGPNHDGCSINYTCTTPLPGGPGNITNDPQFVNAGAGNYRLLPTSPCVNAGNNALVVGSTDLDGQARIVGSQVDMGVYEYMPLIRYVSSANPAPVAPYTNWLTAATNIQDAIDVASINDTILVSNGVYATGGRVAPGSLLTNRVLIGKPVTVQSVNGPSVTVIRGAGPNGITAVRCVWMTNGATLVGFTLTNGAVRTSGDLNTERSGGGLWAQSTAAVVSNCLLTGNSASSGGGAYNGTINNSAFVGNSATLFGGGARTSLLNNVTLAGNSAASGGGAADSQLNNCISYFNTASSDTNYVNGTISHTCTTPLPPGTGNIDTDPRFVNAAAGNIRLLASSPCINSGNNANAPGATDLDGSVRIVGGTVDMGAFEYNQVTASYDSDTDGFTDAEEYIADTQATNGASYFPFVVMTNAPPGRMALVIEPSSTGRVYGVFANTNLLQSPQAWTLVPPEQTGTAAALTLTITNSLPGANYRTGVRLP